MKSLIRILLSIFFAIAIGVHIFYIIQEDGKPLWWHGIYFLTYGVCWWMIFSRNNRRVLIYTIMALFPFITHLYYGYLHLPTMDAMFWVCLLVCLLLPAGGVWLKKEATV